MDCGAQTAVGSLASNLTGGSNVLAEANVYKGDPARMHMQARAAQAARVPELQFLNPQQMQQPVHSGSILAQEFQQQHERARMEAHFQRQSGPPAVYAKPRPQMPMQMHIPQMPMMQNPMFFQPPMQPAQVVRPIPQQDVNLEADISNELDELRVTDSDKEKIRRILDNPDQKWQDSNFVNLLRELEQKESAPEPVTQEDKGNRWANDFFNQLESEDPAWAEQMRQMRETGIDWERELGVDWAQYNQQLSEMGLGMQPKKDEEYEFMNEENPYLEGPDPFEEGLRLMKDGNLNEAVKAFEAACRQDNERSAAWRYLGLCHAHNENEKQAIRAFHTCIKHDPYDLESLLQLGVSYTNDLNQAAALNHLKTWIQHHPEFSSIAMPAQTNQTEMYGSTRELEREVISLFQQASKMNMEDCDVHTTLGVLFNLTCEYEKAEFHFKHAVRLNPEEATLWNKLGATQANGDRNPLALESYRQALHLKPNYTRCMSNLGICFSNLGRHEEAVQTYLACLSYNKDADNVWSHLSLALHQLKRNELVPLCDQRNVDLFRPYFEF